MMDDSVAGEVLLDHFKNPRGRGAGFPNSKGSSGINPACGDRVELFGSVEEDRWSLSWKGAGCVISQASASMMVQALQGRTREEARSLAVQTLGWVAGRGPSPDFSVEGREDMEALKGVRHHPARAACARLAWNLFLELEGKADVAHNG